MKIKSRIGKAEYSDKQIYEFVSNFNNFGNFIPSDQVKDWDSNENSCTFRIDPVGKTGMEIIEKEPYSLIKVSSIPDLSQYKFTIWIQLKKVEEKDTRIMITIEPEVNQMILQFVKSPLQQFVDNLVTQIEKFNFDQPGEK